MIGGVLGSIIAALFCWGTGVSFWWTPLGTGLGVLLELAIRVGSGEEFADALGNLVTAGIELSSDGSSSTDTSSSSDYSGGDYSGGSSSCD